MTIPCGQRSATRLSCEWVPFCNGFDPIFRWLQESIIPRNPDNLEFLQPAQCAYADDLAVASLSLRGLTTALALAFRSVDSIAGQNLNYRKSCWVSFWHRGTRFSAKVAVSELRRVQ